MSSPPASATTILATIQEARLRIRSLSHRHLPFDASLRIGIAGAAEDADDPLLDRPLLRRAAPSVDLLRIQVLRELRESGALAVLEQAPATRSPARRAPAPPTAALRIEAEGASAPLGTGSPRPPAAGNADDLDPDDNNATRIAAATPALLAALAAVGIAGETDASDAASDDEDATAAVGMVEADEATLVQALSPTFEEELEDPVTDEDVPIAAFAASDDEDESEHFVLDMQGEAEPTRLERAAPAVLAAIEAADADDEATRLETRSPELLAALAADDDDGSTTFAFDDEESLFDDEEVDEEATRISRLPPEVLRTIAERRASEEQSSAPILAVHDPSDGEAGSSVFGGAPDELTFSDDGLFGDEDDSAATPTGAAPAFSGDDALFGDDEAGFSDASSFSDSPIEDFPEWEPSGSSEADFDVVFDEDTSDPSEELLEAHSSEDFPEEDEWQPAAASREDDEGAPFGQDEEDEGDFEEEDTAAPSIALGSPRAVSPGIRISEDSDDRPSAGAAIQILGYGKARTLTPTLALGAAPDEGEGEEEEDELILDGDQPRLAVAFQEPDEEPSGRHVPTLTVEPASTNTMGVLEADGSLTSDQGVASDAALTSDDARRFLDQARAAEQGGRLRDAVVHYDDLLGHAPHNIEAHLGRGRCLVDLGDFSAAMSDFTRAEDIAPDSAEPIVEMGNLFFARKEWKKAINYFDHALELEAGHTMALCRRGICHYHRKRYDSAAADLQAAKKNGAKVPGLDRYIRMATKRTKGRRR